MSRTPSDNTINRVPSSSSERSVGSTPVSRIPLDDATVRNQSVAAVVRTAVPSGGTVIRYVDHYITADGSMTTATIFEMAFSFGDATPQEIFTLGSGAVIAEVNVWILQQFDGVGASINVGRTSHADELMDDSEIDPTFLSSYSTRPGIEYLAGNVVNLTIQPGAGATQGRGVLSVYII